MQAQDSSACIKAPSEEIHSKSITYDFLLMTNSNLPWSYYLAFPRYFCLYGLKIAIFAHSILIVDPLVEEHPTTSV